jgi:hypothetical protein
MFWNVIQVILIYSFDFLIMCLFLVILLSSWQIYFFMDYELSFSFTLELNYTYNA